MAPEEKGTEAVFGDRVEVIAGDLKGQRGVFLGRVPGIWELYRIILDDEAAEIGAAPDRFVVVRD